MKKEFLMEKTYLQPKSRENAWLWSYKAFSGVMVIVILTVHLVVNHFVAPQGLLTYADVVKYYQHPIVPIMEILFVIFAVSHALIGVRGILLDLRPSRTFLNVVNWLFSFVGVVAIVYGIWLILTIASRSAAA